MLSIGSCSGGGDDLFSEGETYVPDDSTVEVPDVNIDPDSGMDADLVTNTQEVTFDNAIVIAFTDGGATVTNPFEGKGVTVTNTSGHVVLRSTITDKELNYVLSGITTNGSVKIYGEYKFGIVLNGVGITNPKGAAINNQCGKKTTVTVVTGTNNRLIDGSTYQTVDGEDMKGTFFSEGQLNFYGTGTLEVRGKYKHAICVDDYFRMYEGNITVKEAASDGIHANDYIRIDGGSLTVKSTGEGLDCEKGYVQIEGGTIQIATTGEKSHGVKSLTYTTVNSNETIEILVSGKASKAFKSDGDVTLTKGTLHLQTTGDAFYDTSDQDIASAAGINCDGNILIEDATVTINSSGKGGKGISADGTFTMNGGSVAVVTTGGQFTYGRDDTAAKAIKCKGNLTVNSGKIQIQTSGKEAEGLESKATLTINGGTIEIMAYDDCINAATHIGINGGYIYCNSTTNDGIDSNGTLSVSGGVIVSAGTTSPEEGFDCDQNRFAITGGTLVGIGGATSTPTASACTQRSLIFNPTTLGVGVIHIESSAGKEALTIKLPKTFTQQKMCVLFSSPALAASTSYTIYTGGSIEGGTDFHGLCTGATYTPGTSAGTFTTSNMVTTVGTSSGMGGGGGGPFGR